MSNLQLIDYFNTLLLPIVLDSIILEYAFDTRLTVYNEWYDYIAGDNQTYYTTVSRPMSYCQLLST